MRIFSEKQNRNYFLFLIGFAVLLLLGSLGAGYAQAAASRRALCEWEQAVVSILLADGVSKESLAQALKNPQPTPEGVAFLARIGRTNETPVWLLSGLSQTSRRFFTGSFAAALALSALSISAGLLFLRNRETLYEKAAAVLERYTEGDFSVHLPGSGFGSLSRMFAQAEQLAKALQAQNEALRDTKDFLKNSISDISHQLKTPLAALSMYAEIISQEPDNPETVREFSEKSLRAVMRMEQLIFLLLKEMRLDCGSIPFEKKPCRLRSLMDKASDGLAERAAAENKRLLFLGDEDEILLCDPAWTAEAIGNLIKNALDHVQSGGCITVSWQRSPAMLRITVTDDGCGILPEDIHHIFKRFYRSKNSSGTQGIGLGLSLAKSITEGQGGVISVKSAPGAGASFTLSFPDGPTAS